MHLNRAAAAPPVRPFWKVAVLAVVTASIANVLLSRLAVTGFHLPTTFMPLQSGPVGFFTVVGVTSAALTLALLTRLTTSPHRVFRMVALIVLLFSLLPDVLLLRQSPFPGTTPAGVWTLMLLHVVAYGASVLILTGQQNASRPTRTSPSAS